MGGPSSNSSDSSGGGGTYSAQLKTIQRKKKGCRFHNSRWSNWNGC